jgi:hypothetical protein
MIFIGMYTHNIKDGYASSEPFAYQNEFSNAWQASQNVILLQLSELIIPSLIACTGKIYFTDLSARRGLSGHVCSLAPN